MHDAHASYTFAATSPLQTPDTNRVADGIRAKDLSEMRQWSEGITINKPIPRDLLPILAKDDAKQLEIIMKNMSLRSDG
ncbi:hypothetical protein EJ02DRAFT_452964 [Clathrospora elynae]|uniref:Uncharacterized protein n=1 Tax=Clathrospora elynae TaxID=706981 RepID=A0A6A5SVJ9_9PLEO|nr:hypothetical protein EJ02DRAFT_452964 [Clathrospora elynae]